jgi:uncharacterized protein (DUF1330 family)
MVYITQLIYIREGAEDVFDRFEKIAIPIISKHNGKLLLRVRPAEHEIIEKSIDTPYEIHLVEFASETDFADFLEDEERRRFLHLKEESIRSSWLFKGVKL